MDLLVFLFNLIRSAFEQSQVQTVLTRLEVPRGALRIPDNVSAAEVERVVVARAQAIRAQLAQLVADAQAAQDASGDVERNLGAVRSCRVLVDVFRTVRPTLAGALEQGRALSERANGIAPGAVLGLATRAEVAELARTLAVSAVQTQVLSVVAASRADPEAALRLADADAIATSMLEPVQTFARAHDLGLPAQTPIALPADPGWEAIWFGLLPGAYPILFVPADFERDLYRFASVPHEMGHLLWRDLPGLADEVRKALALPAPRAGLVSRGVLLDPGRIGAVAAQLYANWLSEIWADLAATYLVGPAALRGFQHSFAAPDAPATVMAVRTTLDGTAYDEHPPPHLRVHLSAHLLALMGFDREAAALRAAWDAAHPQPEHLSIRTSDGGTGGVPFEAMLGRGMALVDELYMAQLASLAGFRVADVPGLEMSPGLWARVQRRSAELAADAPFHDDGRVVLAAAIEARAQRPALSGVITRGLRRAILGRDADERRIVDPHYAGSAARPRSHWATDVRVAVALREALAGRRSGPHLRRF